MTYEQQQFGERLKDAAQAAYNAARHKAMEEANDSGRYNSDAATIELGDSSFVAVANDVLRAAGFKTSIVGAYSVRIYSPFGGLRSKNTAQANVITRHLDGVPGIEHRYVSYRFLREEKRQ